MSSKPLLDLICPAGSLPALKAAVDQGADAVYLGLKDNTNARNFAGLNFDEASLRQGIRYAQSKRRKVLMALNTYPQPETLTRWHRAVDKAAELGVDAIILADAGLMAYAVKRHPGLRLHLSVQGSATSYEAVNFYRERFGIERAVLPRVLSLAQVEDLMRGTQVEIELFGFGGLCVMVEGRCLLSSYACGDSPNTFGACSPGHAVRWQQTPAGMETRLNGVLIDRYAEHEKAGYPTLCKGRFEVRGETYYALEEPTSLNSMALLPEMARIGVAGIKIEGRQRSPAYVAQVTRVWRAAIDAVKRAPQSFTPVPAWTAELGRLCEGSMHTLGAYHRPWK
jgi:putative protease